MSFRFFFVTALLSCSPALVNLEYDTVLYLLHKATTLVTVQYYHRIAIAWSRYAHLKRILTASRLPKVLRLRLLKVSVISTLIYGCESWKLTSQARRELNGTVSKMPSRIAGRTIADEAL